MSDKITTIMYGGRVEMVFNPKSPRYRYTVKDKDNQVDNVPVRGVTTLLGDIINKPDLMRWPMNTSHAALFGSRFNEKSLDYEHDWNKALIQPEKSYTAEELHEAMLEGARAHTKRGDKGKDIGTQVHFMVEHYLKDGTTEFVFPEDMPEDEVKMAKKAFNAFYNWWSNLQDAEVVACEVPVYSRKLNFAGTLDIIAKIGGKTYLLDIKTSNASQKAPMGIYAEYFLQMAAYSYAYREEHGTQMDDLGVIRVGKDGKLNIVTAADLNLSVEECEKSFAYACRLHDWLSSATKFLGDRHMVSHLDLPKEES